MHKLRSLIDRLKNIFNISISKIGDQDKWQKISLAIVNVGSQRAVVNSVLSKVADLITHATELELIDYRLEML